MNFQAAIHILRANSTQTIYCRPGQPAHEMFRIKRRFQRCKVRPLGWRSPPYECIAFGYTLENVRFLLLSTNLARERLQIDTDLLHIIRSTADELYSGTNIDDLERPWAPKIGLLSEFFAILVCDAHLEWIFAEITGDRPRQPAYKIFSINPLLTLYKAEAN